MATRRGRAPAARRQRSTGSKRPALQILRERERLLTAIVAHEPECVKVLDAEGRLLEMNPAGLRMIEAGSLDEVRGQCVFPLVAAEHEAAFRELVRRVVAGEERALEFEIVGIKGTRRWLETQAVPLPDATGRRKLVLGITRDITARKAAESALRQSEERFRRTFELAGSGFAHLSLERRFLRVNRKLCEILGYAESELIGRQVQDVSHPDDVARTSAERDRLYAGEIESLSLEKRYVRKDGSVVWAALTLALERDAQGAPLYEIAVYDDITARKAAGDALRESEERFRRIFELAGVGVAQIGMDRRFRRVNRRFCEILGFPEHELVGLTGRDISHPDDRDQMNAQRPQLYAGAIDEVRGEKRYLRKDGSVVWVEYTLAIERDAAGAPQYEIAVYDDISARKTAESALRESEERFRRTFELAGSGVAHVGMDGRFLRVNRRLCEMFGRAESEMVGRSVKELSHPDDRDVSDHERARMHRGEVDVARLQKRYLRKDGSTLWVEMSVTLERDPAGTPLYEISVLEDIGARKAAQLALQESEARFRSLTELSSDWFWEQDADYRFTRLEGRNVAGGDPELSQRLLGKRRWDSGLEVEGGWDAHRARLEAREPFHDVLMWRTMEDGNRRYVSLSGEPMFAADGSFAGYRGVGRDVTANRRAAELLRLEHQVLRALSEAQDEAGGLRAALQAVCEEEHWSCGRFFRLDEERQEMCFEIAWGVEGPAIAAFLAASRDMRLGRGQGLIGHAWARGEAVWAADAAKDPRSIAQAPKIAGLHGVFVFPVLSAGRVLGVCSFISDRVREPDERLLQATRVLGTQIGQFVQRMRAEENIRRFRLGMDSSADMILLIDVATMRFIDVNSTACKLLGYSREELLAMGPQDVLPVSREQLAGYYQQLVDSPATVGSMHSHYRCKDGSQLPFEATRRVLLSGDRPIVVAISRDVRERIAAEQALRESEARFRALTAMSSDFFWETDAEHRLTDMVYGQSFQGKMDEAVGKAAWDVPYTHPDEAGWAVLRAKVERHEPFRDFEFGRARREGGVRYFSVSGEPRFDAGGAFAGYRGVGRDITDLVLARERIASLAYHDPLTGLANRTSLVPALEQAVERTRRRGSKLAGVFLDLDGFKQINDLHGHDAGDRLLVELAQRLRAALRSSDPVARLGGDEFFVVLEDLHSNLPAERVAQKLLAAVHEPYDLGGGREARVSGSIGVSVFPDDAGDAVTLMKHADSAMYAAKQAGKNAYRFFAAGPAANDGRTAADEKTV